jgi:hypothetical protein
MLLKDMDNANNFQEIKQHTFPPKICHCYKCFQLLYLSHAFTYLPLKSGTTIWSSCSAKVDVNPRTNPSISGPTVSCMQLFKINYILIDGLVRGLTSTLAEQEDHIVVPDLRGK